MCQFANLVDYTNTARHKRRERKRGTKTNSRGHC